MQIPDFLPDTLNEWMGFAATIIIWIGLVWKAWESVVTKINGLGGRVATLETGSIDREARLRTVESSVIRTAQDNVSIHERMARAEAIAAELKEDLVDMRIDIISAISDVKAAVMQSDSSIRERIARIEGSTPTNAQNKEQR